MRSPKDSDSPSGFDREAPHRWRVYDTIAHQEAGVRKLTDERWQRRIQPLMATEDNALVPEFGTWVAL